jgi:hypothetical protein
VAAPVTIFGINGQALSSVPPLSDNVQGPGAPIRLASRGEQIGMNLWNGQQALAMEGSYWIATTATPGTGITLTVATGTSFSDTQALIVLNNNDSATNTNRSLYLDFVTIICTTTPTGTTAHFVAHRIDGAVRGTAGTKLGATSTDAKQSNMNYGGTSIGSAYALGASAVSVAASASVRNVGRNVIRAASTPSWVVGDHVTIKFGSAEMAAGGVNLGATTASGITVYAPPLVIGPGQSYVMNEWATSRSGALSGEIVMGWVER